MREPDLLLYATDDRHWAGPRILRAAKTGSMTIEGVSAPRPRTPQNPAFLQVDDVGDLAKAFDPFPGLTTWLSPAWIFPDRLMNSEEGRGYDYPQVPCGLVLAVGASYTGQCGWIVNQAVDFAWQLGLHLENVEVQNCPVAGQGYFVALERFWLKRRQIETEFAVHSVSGHPRIMVWEFPILDAIGILNSRLSY